MGRQFLIKHANDNSVKSEYLAELGVTAEQIKAAQESGWDLVTHNIKQRKMR